VLAVEEESIYGHSAVFSLIYNVNKEEYKI